ncbi:MAG: cytochrome c [Caulobacter sp.]|nr:cytochrome c [Caulobacter sp.]
MRLSNPLLMLPVLAAIAAMGMTRQAPAAAAPDAPPAPAPAVVPSAERGHALVARDCAACHAIEAVGDSDFGPAPPFRTLHEKYPLEALEEALAEGILSGHPAMPEYEYAPDQIADIIAWMKSLDAE